MGLDKKFLVFGIILCVTAVILGAMGTHALKELLSADRLVSFETGIRYQMYHGISMIALSVIPYSKSTRNWVFYLFASGLLFFSVSIYFLSLSDYLEMDLNFLGPITPIGGSLLIIGWILLLWKSICLKIVNN